MTLSEITAIKDLNKNTESDPAVLLFYSKSSQECDHLNTVLERMAVENEYKSIKFLKCCVEDSSKLAEQMNVNAVPTVAVFKNGNLIKMMKGADPPTLNTVVRSLIKADGRDGNNGTDFNTYLQNLTKKAPIMLFMKGSPDVPKCGFSREIVSLLKSYNAKFETFDILEDEKVRSELKKYSNWPTYPQLYVNGQFIGGLDIIKEMDSIGELQPLLQVSGERPIDNRLKKLINSSDVMVFMKGDKTTPRCGFSKQLLEILNSTGIPFSTFDILQDEEVRQKLKIYSNWPTYPQIYVKGALIGGLDIIKELKESGELIGTLKAEL